MIRTGLRTLATIVLLLSVVAGSSLSRFMEASLGGESGGICSSCDCGENSCCAERSDDSGSDRDPVLPASSLALRLKFSDSTETSRISDLFGSNESLSLASGFEFAENTAFSRLQLPPVYQLFCSLLI